MPLRRLFCRSVVRLARARKSAASQGKLRFLPDQRPSASGPGRASRAVGDGRSVHFNMRAVGRSFMLKAIARFAAAESGTRLGSYLTEVSQYHCARFAGC